ncbi:uncharacterized protein [Rutidosis leptorrhynchoides]|uniref:uncharacterized protein n=1 Tax=Rutidosis leptorrhynchoides TaxID=125765 RepID=UPI003A98E62E
MGRSKGIAHNYRSASAKFCLEIYNLPIGKPCEIVSDNGAQIAKDPFKSSCEELNIVQKFISVAHPQANGLCEVTNRDIVSDIKKRLNEKRTRWVDELSNVMVANFDESANDDALCENLNFMEERRLMAAIKEANNKQHIVKYYNKKVRAFAFDVGEWVLCNNEASRAENVGKLGANWEGPYQIIAITRLVPTNSQTLMKELSLMHGMLRC